MNLSIHSLFSFWLDPIGLTPIRATFALGYGAISLLGLFFLGKATYFIYGRIRRHFFLKTIGNRAMDPTNVMVKIPPPTWPGDRDLILDELLDRSRREKGALQAALRKELAKPEWIHPELLRMTSFLPRRRAKAAERLGQMGDLKALPFLERACMDPFRIVRQTAAKALFAVDEKSFAHLLPRLFSAYSVWREGEVERLFDHLGRNATPTLIQVLDHGNDRSRERTLRLLGRLGDSKALEILMVQSQTAPTPSLRQIAQETLKNVP